LTNKTEMQRKKEQTCQEIIEEVVTDARALLAGRK
jgi:enoyl-[acyl-carrier protein] reductase II